VIPYPVQDSGRVAAQEGNHPMPIGCSAAKVIWALRFAPARAGHSPAMNTPLHSPVLRPGISAAGCAAPETRPTGPGSILARSRSHLHCNGAMMAAASVAAAGVQSGRILVVDDDESVRLVLSSMLRGCKFMVSCANDGEHGWSTLMEGHFDLLITDNSMPVLSGVNLLRRLRAKMNPMPAILISGCMPWEEPDLDYLLRPGLALEKPFSFPELLDGIQKLVTKQPGA